MKLIEQVKGFLEATDTTKYITYAAYSKDCISRGVPAITAAQWDGMVDLLGARQMQYSHTPDDWRQNMQAALEEETISQRKTQS